MIRDSRNNGRRSRCPLVSSKKKRSAANKLAATVKASLPPGLAQPALRALAAAGYSNLDQFSKIRVEDLSKLHGIGPKAIELIRDSLKHRGQSFLP